MQRRSVGFAFVPSFLAVLVPLAALPTVLLWDATRFISTNKLSDKPGAPATGSAHRSLVLRASTASQ
jgi:hypothetical protein